MKHPRTRPTYEAVRDAAHVGTEAVAKAFEEMEASGDDAGQKSPTGQPSHKNRTDSSIPTSTLSASTTTYTDPNTGKTQTVPWDPEPGDPDWSEADTPSQLRIIALIRVIPQDPVKPERRI